MCELSLSLHAMQACENTLVQEEVNCGLHSNPAITLVAA